jgi:hypothetical protein
VGIRITNNSGDKFVEIWPLIIPPFTGQPVKGVFS